MPQPPEKRLVTEAALDAALAGFSGGGATAYKTTATVRNNTNVRVPDPDLRLPVQAGGVYRVLADVFYAAESVADFSLAWSAPSGSAFTWCPDAIPTSAAAGGTMVNRAVRTSATSNINMGGLGASAGIGLRIAGLLTAGGDGELILMWAQVTADASDVTVMAGSMLRLEPLT